MAVQTQLIPFSELAPGEAGHIRTQVIKAVLEQAGLKLPSKPADLVVRDIRVASDIVLYSRGAVASVEDWSCVTGTTADAYETMATGTMGDQRWVAIYGLKRSAEDSCTAIQFNIGGGLKAIIQVQALRSDDDYTGFIPFGIVIPQNTIYTISRWVRMVSNQTNLVLKGVVIEPRGLVVSP